ncbi:hypothetical protein [uncultured Chryseobacterium sp.]|uniref:hypothetical protein n=1 Tax=uncultured Chryseobacterium sp. TaxID=259322 RepID=UPI0025F6C4BD|nr:hypothetical protein [uncultured Chryseobacterium sp.]
MVIFKLVKPIKPNHEKAITGTDQSNLDLMIEKAISYNIGRHNDRYFPPRKTAE